MASTGATLPGSAASTAVSPYDDQTWVNPTYILADDTSYAVVTHPAFDIGFYTYVLKAYNFDFSAIPDGSTINGVTVTLYGCANAGAADFACVRLLDASGTLCGSDYSGGSMAGADATETFGSATDKWGLGTALTAALVKDADFGVGIACVATLDNTDVRIEWVKIDIDYTAPVTETLAGSIDGTGSITGAIVRTRGIVGAVAGTSAINGSISITKRLSSTIDGVSSITCAISRTRPLAGSIDGVSTITGDLTELTGAYEYLEGAIAGTSSITGSLSRMRGLASNISGTGGITGTASITKTLNGAIAGAGTLTGALGRRRPLAGLIAGVTTLTGDLTVSTESYLAGSITGTSVITGALSVTKPLAGTITGSGTLLGALSKDTWQQVNVYVRVRA